MTLAAETPGQRVVAAAKARDVRTITALIKQGADVNTPQADGATALHWAAHWDDGDAADALLRARARVNVVNEYGTTPLSLAALNGSAAMVGRLLKAGADPNGALPSGESVLMTASRTGNPEAVKLLLAGGARIDAQEAVYGQTALMWATAERQHAVVRVLIEAGADVTGKSRNGYTPILFAARTGDIELARLLLDKGARLDDAASDGVTPLLMATVRNHLPLARFLLDKGARPDAGAAGFTPLHWASGIWEGLTTYDFRGGPLSLEGLVDSEKPAFIKLLLEHGADVNAQVTKVPPRFGGRTSRVFGPVSEVGVTPLWIAAASGDIDTLKLLLAHGATPGTTAKDGTTALIVASGLMHSDSESHIGEARYLEIAKLLISLGADVNAVNAGGNTAMHGTAWGGFDSITRLLVQHGAQLSPKNKQGLTPLKVADGIVVAMQLHYQKDVAMTLRELGATE